MLPKRLLPEPDPGVTRSAEVNVVYASKLEHRGDSQGTRLDLWPS
jgi:hypothetical protein